MSSHYLQLMKGDGILRTEEFRRAIAEAKAHAYEVVGREHIKGERHERVRHFCISLRRRLGWHFDKKEISRLGICQLFVWDDAGVLARNPRLFVDNSLLETAVMASARYDSQFQKSETQQIVEELTEVKRSLASIVTSMGELDGLAKRAEDLNTRFEALEKEMEVEHSD